MPNSSDGERHSHAFTPELISDPKERAEREARNGLRQYDVALHIIDDFLTTGRKFQLRLSTILQLHRAALEGISAFAGNFRPAGVEIGGSRHNPPGAHLIPELIEGLCDYVNENWNDKTTAVHLAAYVLWRLNWIHPFDDGNGRTARAVSYVILCIKSGFRLPGTNTIPEQISQNKKPYYEALELADAADRAGKIDVGQLANLLGDMLAKQLVSVHELATHEKV